LPLNLKSNNKFSSLCITASRRDDRVGRGGPPPPLGWRNQQRQGEHRGDGVGRRPPAVVTFNLCRNKNFKMVIKKLRKITILWPSVKRLNWNK
jgi:hypothetical protein